MFCVLCPNTLNFCAFAQYHYNFMVICSNTLVILKWTKMERLISFLSSFPNLRSFSSLLAREELGQVLAACSGGHDAPSVLCTASQNCVHKSRWPHLRRALRTSTAQATTIRPPRQHTARLATAGSCCLWRRLRARRANFGIRPSRSRACSPCCSRRETTARLLVLVLQLRSIQRCADVVLRHYVRGYAAAGMTGLPA